MDGPAPRPCRGERGPVTFICGAPSFTPTNLGLNVRMREPAPGTRSDLSTHLATPTRCLRCLVRACTPPCVRPLLVPSSPASSVPKNGTKVGVLSKLYKPRTPGTYAAHHLTPLTPHAAGSRQNTPPPGDTRQHTPPPRPTRYAVIDPPI